MTVPLSADALSLTANGAALLSPTSFELAAGGSLAVTGSNGSGKTTLLRLLAGSIQPSRGCARIGGEAPDDRNPAFRSRVAALLSPAPFARGLTLREHIALVSTSWGHSLDDSYERADHLLVEFAIDRLTSRYPHELSSGQTQLFSLALTLARPFSLLLLDEPEQRLDAERQAMVGNILSELVDRGTTIVMASHSPVLVNQVSDQVLHLVEGVHDSGV